MPINVYNDTHYLWICNELFFAKFWSNPSHIGLLADTILYVKRSFATTHQLLCSGQPFLVHTPFHIWVFTFEFLIVWVNVWTVDTKLSGNTMLENNMLPKPVHIVIWIRVDSRLAPSQWETVLQSNAVSHWLGTNLESALQIKASEVVSCMCPSQVRVRDINKRSREINKWAWIGNP